LFFLFYFWESQCFSFSLQLTCCWDLSAFMKKSTNVSWSTFSFIIIFH
jgi:hypothetical protein